jgi:hypothetical protein
LVPTQAAHDYFDSVGKAMTEALSQHWVFLAPEIKYHR